MERFKHEVRLLLTEPCIAGFALAAVEPAFPVNELSSESRDGTVTGAAGKCRRKIADKSFRFPRFRSAEHRRSGSHTFGGTRVAP